MRLAFAGCSGSGKSTLAAYVKERYRLPINPVGSRSVAAEMGFASPYEVDQAGRRAEFQDRLLHAKVQWEKEHDSFVTDRTAMDNVAYTSLHSIDTVTDAYLSAAAEAMNCYDRVILCPYTAFCNLAGDPTRREGKAYHAIFDALLSELIERYAPRGIIVLWSAELHIRKKRIDSLF